MHQIILLASIFIHTYHIVIYNPAISVLKYYWLPEEFNLLYFTKWGWRLKCYFWIRQERREKSKSFQTEFTQYFRRFFFVCVCLLIIRESFNFEIIFFFDFAIFRNCNIEILFFDINLREHVNEKYYFNSE